MNKMLSNNNNNNMTKVPGTVANIDFTLIIHQVGTQNVILMFIISKEELQKHR